MRAEILYVFQAKRPRVHRRRLPDNGRGPGLLHRVLAACDSADPCRRGGYRVRPRGRRGPDTATDTGRDRTRRRAAGADHDPEAEREHLGDRAGAGFWRPRAAVQRHQRLRAAPDRAEQGVGSAAGPARGREKFSPEAVLVVRHADRNRRPAAGFARNQRDSARTWPGGW